VRQRILASARVLIALLLPAVQAARETALRAQFSNNLKQLGIAMHNYHDVIGSFPTLLWALSDPAFPTNNTFRASFFQMVLPLHRAGAGLQCDQLLGALRGRSG
jgi:Protein of unknown function (DUF1559)